MDEEDHELVFVDAVRKRRSRVQKCLTCSGVTAVVVMFLAVLSLAIALAVVVSREGGSSCPAPVCQSESCKQLAQSITSNLNTSVDPCSDFYNFSCGGWLKNNPLPPSRSRYSPFDKLDEENKEALIELLEGNQDDDIDAVRKLRALYQMCMNVTVQEELKEEPLIELINYAIGGWPLVGLGGSGYSSGSGSGSGPSDILNSTKLLYTKLLGSSAFFSLYVGVDDKNSSRYTIAVSQDGLTLPSPEYYKQPEYVNAFKSYAVKVLSLINATNSDDYLPAVEKIIELETKLANITVPAVELRDPIALYNNMSIADFTKKYSGTIDWEFVIRNMSEIAEASVPFPEEQIIVQTPSYLGNLSMILRDEDEDILFNYVGWHLINSYVRLLSQDFKYAYYNFTEVVYGGGPRDRNETCLSLGQSTLPIALARMYTEFVLPEGTKETVEVMISQIKSAFKERVSEKTWLDQSTKDACNDKVDKITERVAYPTLLFHDSYVNGLYENYTWDIFDKDMGLLYPIGSINFFESVKNLRRLHTAVDKMEWDIAPTAVNAYYNPAFNQFTFLEGILAPPFIHSGWPEYIMYGALGSVIGHELTHGFDDQGQQFDAQGNLKKWWDDSSTANFKERQKCFVNQYSHYEIFGLKVNGNLTLGENLADNGGVKTSYQAYKNVTADKGTVFSLPELDYTPEQLFFISFGQLWCSRYTKAGIAAQLLTNPHSPGPFRVEGVLVNSKEFADAFKCPAGSAMNPKDKCLMW